MGDTVKTERLQTDVLVIGGGTAGCYAALTIAEQNDAVSVLICEKAHIKRSGCLAAGVNALNAYITKGRVPQGLCGLCEERCRRNCTGRFAADHVGAAECRNPQSWKIWGWFC